MTTHCVAQCRTLALRAVPLYERSRCPCGRLPCGVTRSSSSYSTKQRNGIAPFLWALARCALWSLLCMHRWNANVSKANRTRGLHAATRVLLQCDAVMVCSTPRALPYGVASGTATRSFISAISASTRTGNSIPSSFRSTTPRRRVAVALLGPTVRQRSALPTRRCHAHGRPRRLARGTALATYVKPLRFSITTRPARPWRLPTSERGNSPRPESQLAPVYGPSLAGFGLGLGRCGLLVLAAASGPGGSRH